MAYDSYTKLLLHGDVFPFVDAIGKTVTNTDVTLDTTNKVFGAGSMAFNGSSAFLSLADSADWDFGNGNFTIDGRIRANELTTGKEYYIICQMSGSANESAWILELYNDTVYFFYYLDGTFTEKTFSRSITAAPSVGTWYHLAVVRNGTEGYIFWNGVKLGANYNFATDTIANQAQSVFIGCGKNSSAVAINLWNGNQDELRVSKGIARWTANFTPPIKQYMPQKASTNIIGYIGY